MTSVERTIPTPSGDAHARLVQPDDPWGWVVLGHGAAGSVDAPDLVAVTEVAGACGLGVALVTQPYRVKGRRLPDRAPRLDEAWCAVIAAVRDDPGMIGPLLVGGRSSGARVACRTAEDVAADGVLCLAFPLQPRARKDGTRPPDRMNELAAVTVPVLVIQGERDPFGIPEPEGSKRQVIVVAGDHSLRAGRTALVDPVKRWFEGYRPRN